MRYLMLGFILAIGSSVPVLAEDCSKDVVAAIDKQHASKAFRIVTTQQTAEGAMTMTVDYLPPDRMMQHVTGATLPGEQQTILVGSRAFAGTNGALEELLPQFTQSIVAEFQRSLESPKNVTGFVCRGEQVFEGKSYLAYTRADAPPAGTAPEDVLVRTLYVDAKTGLPAFNVVARASGEGDPVMKIAYTYPTDIVIEAPVGAPIQKRPN